MISPEVGLLPYLQELRSWQEARSLNRNGNPVVSKVAFFCKKMIGASKTLCYSDRPIFDQERAMVEARAAGGLEAEAKSRLRRSCSR